MKIRLDWRGGVSFTAQSAAGHRVILDGAPEHGGRDAGFRPMEMVLVGLAGCSAFDVVEILRKGRQSIADCLVEVEAERADAVPAVFARIHLHFVVSGEGVSEERVRRAIELSVDKYCSVSAMLRPGVEITHDYDIRESAPGR